MEQEKPPPSASLRIIFSRKVKPCCSLPAIPFALPRVSNSWLGGSAISVTVIAQESSAQQKADPAAVIFDAVNAAKARGIDIVLADTAGRLATQLHLMEEIKKVKRVIAKAEPSAPHETLLVLDANTGQNAINQVKAFDDALGLTGLIITKLDGTAKGGVIAAIARQRQQKSPLPIRFIGVGEGINDLRPFVASEFVEAVFD